MKDIQTKQQRGVALLVALVILLIVSMMGVAGMRSGLFHERIASNAQADAMSFQAAESAIGAMLASANDPQSNDAGLLVNTGAARSHCVTLTQGLVDGVCSTAGSDGHVMDTRGLLQSQATSKFDFKSEVIQSDSSVLLDYKFHTLGTGRFKASLDLPYTHYNRQEWRKRGPGGGPFELSGSQASNLPGNAF